MKDIMKFYRWGFLTEEETANNLTQILGVMSAPELRAELARVESELSRVNDLIFEFDVEFDDHESALEFCEEAEELQARADALRFLIGVEESANEEALYYESLERSL